MRVFLIAIERESTALYTCCQEVQGSWPSAPRLGAKLCHGREIPSTILSLFDARTRPRLVINSPHLNLRKLLSLSNAMWYFIQSTFLRYGERARFVSGQVESSVGLPEELTVLLRNSILRRQ